jgi:multidrug efflux pump subunit AcrB
VVVRENIFKHLERGEPPFKAALEGTKEIALSVLATTLTIVAVFLPVAFVSGMVGQFFRQFGVTVSAAVLISLFVAFSLDPMLSSRFSRAVDHSRKRGPIARAHHALFSSMETGYKRMLSWALNHKALVGLAILGSILFMGFIGGLMGSEFVTSEDRGQFLVTLELPAGTSLTRTGELSLQAEHQLLEDKDMKLVYATIGPDGDANKVTWRVVTTPKDQRTLSLGVLRDRARKVALQVMPNAKVNVTDPPFVEGAQTEAPIMIDVRGASYADIAPSAEKIGAILRTTPGVQDVQVKYTPGRPELQVEIDRQKIADRGLQVAQLAMALRTAMDGDEATKLRQGKDEVPIRVRVDARDRSSPDALARLMITTPKGPTALADVAHFRQGEGPQVIEREDRSRQIQIWAAPRGRALGDLLKEFAPRIAGLKLPAGVSYMYDGQIKMMNETNSNMGLALGLGVIFIFIVLASQFESFIHPVTIMLTLPLALFGAVLALFLTDNTMAMGTLIGIILLMGLVTKNAILLVDRAIVRVRDHGEPPEQAILEAGPERLRPILMTSAAMILGMLPTAISHGEGSEFRGPMAIAVIGGVISSTLLSLIVVPVFYLSIERAKKRLGRLFRRGGPPAAEAARSSSGEIGK